MGACCRLPVGGLHDLLVSRRQVLRPSSSPLQYAWETVRTIPLSFVWSNPLVRTKNTFVRAWCWNSVEYKRKLFFVSDALNACSPESRLAK